VKPANYRLHPVIMQSLTLNRCEGWVKHKVHGGPTLERRICGAHLSWNAWICCWGQWPVKIHNYTNQEPISV